MCLSKLLEGLVLNGSLTPLHKCSFTILYVHYVLFVEVRFYRPHPVFMKVVKGFLDTPVLDPPLQLDRMVPHPLFSHRPSISTVMTMLMVQTSTANFSKYAKNYLLAWSHWGLSLASQLYSRPNTELLEVVPMKCRILLFKVKCLLMTKTDPRLLSSKSNNIFLLYDTNDVSGRFHLFFLNILFVFWWRYTTYMLLFFFSPEIIDLLSLPRPHRLVSSRLVTRAMAGSFGYLEKK